MGGDEDGRDRGGGDHHRGEEGVHQVDGELAAEAEEHREAAGGVSGKMMRKLCGKVYGTIIFFSWETKALGSKNSSFVLPKKALAVKFFWFLRH